MATDKLLWGSARPRFRIGTTAVQTNGTNYVLNQPLGEHRIIFPKEGILSQAIKGKLFEKKRGNRGIFSFVWDLLDRPSAETLITILNTSDDLYIRPHFNYYKEYLCRNVQGWEMERFGKVNQPYCGGLSAETISLETAIPTESPGSFNFDGSTKITNALAGGDITGDITLEFWLKTPSSFSANQIFFKLTADSGPDWEGQIESDGKVTFITDDHILTSTNVLSVNTWYHIMIRRVNTDDKRIVVDSVVWASGADSKAANDITSIQLADTTSDFDGLIQIFRMYSINIYDVYEKCAIEAIPSSLADDIEIWWDFSQGTCIDLSGNGNTGIVTGTTAFYKESFPDKHYEILT